MADNRLAANQKVAIEEAERILGFTGTAEADLREVDADFAEEAIRYYGTSEQAVRLALSEIEHVLDVEAVALTPYVVGSKYSHEKANDHARRAHLHLSAAIAMDKAAKKLVEPKADPVAKKKRFPWYVAIFGLLAVVGGAVGL